MKKFGDIIRCTLSTKEKVEIYQQLIRDAEWSVLKSHFPEKCSFIDVGCGAGYTLKKASEDLGCTGVGIDPAPGDHGVGRYSDGHDVKILKGDAENIPFENDSFDLVFSSHVLEHVNDELASLKEMKRVLKNDGVLIIGMPTAFMSWISLFSNYLFTTHIKIYNVFRYFFSKNTLTTFVSIFVPRSHSYPRAKTIFYDLEHYRIKKWKRTIAKEFEIIEVLKPCLYPYPDYPQWFKLRKSKLGTSSVFFVCNKK
jgi:ubiquinone/menaquinone biosynthesis C-methylase UbiE